MNAPGISPAAGCVIPPAAAALTDAPPWLSPEDAGARLNVSGRTAREWARNGCEIGGRVIRLASVMTGNRYQFTAAGCDQFVRDCTAARDAVAGFRYDGSRTKLRDAPPDENDGYDELLAELRRPVGR